HGAVPVLAAGNSTAATSENYGNLDAVVVAATGPNRSQPYYSSSVGNAKWGIAAPGGEGSPVGGGPGRDVLSTWWEAGKSNQYATDAGTSMAAPHVAGVLALVLAQGLAPAAAVRRVLASVTPLPCGGTCRGEVDAAGAVGAARAGPTPTAPAAAQSGTGTP